MTEKADSLVLQGADHIYNVQFDSARANFEKVQELYPEHPVGYFLDAMVDWWRITIHRNEEAFEDEFLDNIDDVIELCDDLLDKDPNDLVALFFKGGALGYRGRYYAIKEEWISAASDGKQAFEIMRRCHIKAPSNHDIMLGSGIYNYFAEAIPEEYPLTKPLLYFLPPGDKTIGMYQLRAATFHARYTKIEAMVVLLQLFYSFENDYKSALEWANKLHGLYPRNPYFHRYLARCYNRLGKWDSLEYHWREIVTRSINRMEGYNNKTAREGCYYVGRALMRKRENESAIKYFEKSMEISKYINEDDSGFYLSAQLNVAKLYYKIGNKEKAKVFFTQVIEDDDYENSHSVAERYLQKL
jgi:tetratricopeptide (TPR) repeat protein